MTSRAKNLITSIAKPLLFLVLALGLVPLGRAQFNQSLNVGVNKIRVASPLQVTAQTYTLLIPATASQITISMENTTPNAVSYTLTVNEASLEITPGSGPFMACYQLGFNGQLVNASTGAFPVTSLGGTPVRYACPTPSSHKMRLSIAAQSASTDSTAVYVIVDQGQSYLLAPQSPSGNAYTHIATATSTQIKSAPGTLHALTVNTTAAGTITIFDNTACSGPVIAILAASVATATYLYDVAFTTGLCVTTAAASDVTVSSR